MTWRACERFGLLPPGVKAEWDTNHVLGMAQMLAYENIRQQEEADDRQ